MNLKQAANARLILDLQDTNNEVLKVLGDAKGKIVFYYDDSKTECFTLNCNMTCSKIVDTLKEHYEQHNRELDRDLEVL